MRLVVLVTALLVLPGRASADDTTPRKRRRPPPPAATLGSTQIEVGPFAGLHRYDAGDRVISGGIVGLRVAVFPRDFVGVEVEGDVMPGESDDGSSPQMASYGLQAVGRIRVPHLALGGVAGGGVHSVATPESLSRIGDSFLHWGAVVAAPFGRVALRLDVRHQIGLWREDVSQAFAVSLGLSLRLGGD